MVHAPRFLRKTRANIFGGRNDLARQIQPRSLHSGGRGMGSRAAAALALAHWRLRADGFWLCAATRLSPSQVEARCAQALFNLPVAAQRTLHQSTLALGLEILLGPKPPLEDMAVPALKIKNFHGWR
jgi:hypothetical protein